MYRMFLFYRGNMMTIKKISLLALFFIAAGAFTFTSCEGICDGENCNETENTSSAEESREFRIRFADPCAQDTIGEHSIARLGSLTIKIDDLAGNNIFQQSFTRNEISTEMKVSGIDDAENAILTISGFDLDNPNEVRWQGRITNLTFKKGETTSIDIVLYPLQGRSCLPDRLNIPRFGHVSTLLPDGRILLTGGFIQASGKTWIAGKSVEIIDVESGVIEQLADMHEERAMHHVVPMPDGSVIIFGGVRQLRVENIDVEGYPELPYSFHVQATSVENYMPLYPKLNMRNNNIGMEIQNTTRTMALDKMPFLPNQSYAVDKSNPAKITAYLVGGMTGTASEGFKSSDKVYTFDIIDTGTEYTVSSVREIATGEKEPSLLSCAGIYQNSVFSVGGRRIEADHSGAIYSEQSVSNWGEEAPNLFYTACYTVGENLYSFGGLDIEDEKIAEKRNPGYRYNIAQETHSSSGGGLMSYGGSLFFSDVVYHREKNHFVLLGGAGGENGINNGNHLFQFVGINPFDLDRDRSYPLRFKRVLPRGVIDNDSRLFITGGTDSLNPDGIIVSVIEIDNL